MKRCNLGGSMIKKIMNTLSAIALTVLVSGVVVTLDTERVIATGVDMIAEMSLGPDAVQNTIRGEKIAGGLAALLIIVGGIYVVRGHNGEGLIGVLFIAIGAGLIMRSKEILAGMGLTAAGI